MLTVTVPVLNTQTSNLTGIILVGVGSGSNGQTATNTPTFTLLAPQVGLTSVTAGSQTAATLAVTVSGNNLTGVDKAEFVDANGNRLQGTISNSTATGLTATFNRPANSASNFTSTNFVVSKGNTIAAQITTNIVVNKAAVQVPTPTLTDLTSTNANTVPNDSNTFIFDQPNLKLTLAGTNFGTAANTVVKFDGSFYSQADDTFQTPLSSGTITVSGVNVDTISPTSITISVNDGVPAGQIFKGKAKVEVDGTSSTLSAKNVIITIAR